jgi:hypothetical protein
MAHDQNAAVYCCFVLLLTVCLPTQIYFPNICYVKCMRDKDSAVPGIVLFLRFIAFVYQFKSLLLL